MSARRCPPFASLPSKVCSGFLKSLVLPLGIAQHVKRNPTETGDFFLTEEAECCSFYISFYKHGTKTLVEKLEVVLELLVEVVVVVPQLR